MSSSMERGVGEKETEGGGGEEVEKEEQKKEEDKEKKMEEEERREEEKEEAEFQKGNCCDGVMCPPGLQVAVALSLCLSP